jgi:hypothetical protein
MADAGLFRLFFLGNQTEGFGYLDTKSWRNGLRLLFWLAFFISATCAYAQTPAALEENTAPQDTTKPAAPEAQSQTQNPPPAQSSNPAPPADANPSSTKPKGEGTSPSEEQPKRILGVMPNFRAVSAGAIPPPPTLKQSFALATQNSFDYSSFVFVGMTSALAEWSDAHPQLGDGMPGFGRYCWRGFLDKTDGNYQVLFGFATILHEDERYYARGGGGFWKRFVYSTTRVLITPNYEGHNTFNAAEFLGRGGAQAVSVFYYPSKTRTASAISAKFGYAILRDAATNAFREFWPDIAVHVLHRHP